MVIAISTRGSAESIHLFMLVAVVWFLHRGHWFASALLYGLVVHWRLYPIIYALPLIFWFHQRSDEKKPKYAWLKYGVVSAGVFLTLGAWLHFRHGQEFIDQAYLYHLVRRDHRHNFSVFFLPLYLVVTNPAEFPSVVLNSVWVSSLPQLAVMGLIASTRFKPEDAETRQWQTFDLLCRWFLVTWVFVMFNKVLTSQYFMWWLVFMPIIMTGLMTRLPFRPLKTELATMTIVWVIGQAGWLGNAYRLEMLGHNTFVELWACSVILFIIHGWIAVRFIRILRAFIKL
jgi:phosphatidylinositol glycan class M